MVCINGYYLEGDRCINYVVSSYLTDGVIGLAVTMERCIKWGPTTCLTMCPETSFMYTVLCFDI